MSGYLKGSIAVIFEKKIVLKIPIHDLLLYRYKINKLLLQPLYFLFNVRLQVKIHPLENLLTIWSNTSIFELIELFIEIIPNLGKRSNLDTLISGRSLGYIGV